MSTAGAAFFDSVNRGRPVFTVLRQYLKFEFDFADRYDNLDSVPVYGNFWIPILSDTFEFDSRKERFLTHIQSVEPVKSSILKTRSDPAYDIFEKNNFEQNIFDFDSLLSVS